MNQESLSKEVEHVLRKIPYTSPSLTHFGQVRELTRAGIGSMAEDTWLDNGMGGKLCNFFQNTRYPCSERRTKENIARIGDHSLGFGLYLFNYRPEFQERWGQGRQFGVMIDEVETVMPEAVLMHPDGYKRVDYEALGITRLNH